MRILIIDDHPLFIVGMTALLSELDPDCEVLSAPSLASTIAAFSGQTFELILLDMLLPGTSQLKALAELLPCFDGAAIVVVSGVEDVQLIREAIEAGADGYIPKSTDPEQTKRALQLVLARGTYLPPLLLQQLAPQRRSHFAEARPEFSQRQKEVLKHLLEGKPNKLIARELDIAEGTVKAHISAIFGALGVKTRSQAMYRSHQLGLTVGPFAEGSVHD